MQFFIIWSFLLNFYQFRLVNFEEYRNEKRNDYTANASEQMSTCVYHMFIGTGSYKCSILNS